MPSERAQKQRTIIERGVCGFSLTRRSASECRENPPLLTLDMKVTIDEMPGDLEKIVTPPAPNLTMEKQGGVSAGLWGRSPRTNHVLPFQRLAGLKVAPKKGLPKISNPVLQLAQNDIQPLLHLRGESLSNEEEESKDRFWLHSPFTYL